MAFTYTEGGTGDRDRVRFELQDVEEDRALFSDAEIDDLLAQEGDSVLNAAGHGCELLALRYARDFDFQADGARFNKSSLTKHFRDLGVQLRNRARGSVAVMPRRKDGYSSTIDSDTATGGSNNSVDWDRGRWDEIGV